MLMPAGTPDPAKERTSSEVKSGKRNLSFSNSLGHGSRGRMSSAASTRAFYGRNSFNYIDIWLSNGAMV